MNSYPNIKAMRLQHNYKQEYVADILGVSQPEYSKMETGIRKLDPAIIKELCKLYDVGADVLLRQYALNVDQMNDRTQQAQQQVGTISQDMISKLLENYSFLLDNYVRQQQVQERIIDKLINNSNNEKSLSS